MTAELTCPTCSETLAVQDEDTFRCPEEHDCTVVGLALTTDVAALRALWMAIRALEDAAASLRYMAAHYSDAVGQAAAKRLEEAEAVTEAAEVLRGHARRAQQRLDALPGPRQPRRALAAP